MTGNDWLSPWSRVLLEKLTVPQLIKKLLAFYGSRMFIIAFTKADHLSLYLARLINFTLSYPFFEDPL